jgi:spermidine synthase
VAVIYLAVGMVLFLAVVERMRTRVRAAGAIVVAAGIVLMLVFSPGWNRKLMTSAVYVYAPLYQDTEGLEESMGRRRILFYDEGPGATVSVERQANLLSIRIDGKIDASSSGDMITQELISHLPLLLHSAPDTVLLIGLGSGVSLGSAATHQVRHIDCVELLENVIDAAHFFDEYSYNSMSDPRVNMIVGDGRNHVWLTDRKYDVVISQPTNPWISGVGDLFTLEFFAKARSRLKPGGLMCAWFQIYHMGDPELRATLKAFVSVFPNSTLWLANESDVILIGSTEPVDIDERMIERMKRPGVREDLARVLIKRETDLLSALLMKPRDLNRFAGEARELHTDDNMLVEFRAGRRIFEATHIIHLHNFYRNLKIYAFEHLDADLNRRIAEQAAARKLTMQGTIERLRGNLNQAMGLYRQAYASAPGDPYVLSKYGEIQMDMADALLIRGDFKSAAREYRKVLGHPELPDTWRALDGLALALLSMGRYEGARDTLAMSLELNPHYAGGHFNMGDILVALGDTAGAIGSYERAIELDPDDPDIANNLAWFYAVKGENLERALELALSATGKDRHAGYFDTLGWVYYRMGDLDSARRHLEQALEIETNRVESLYHLAVVHGRMGEKDRARELLQEVLRLDRDGAFAPMARMELDAINSN